MLRAARALALGDYGNRNSLERRACISVNTVRVNWVDAATGHLPEPLVVDAAARLPVVGPAQKNTGAVNTAATAMRAIACDSLRWTCSLGCEQAPQVALNHVRAPQRWHHVRATHHRAAIVCKVLPPA